MPIARGARFLVLVAVVSGIAAGAAGQTPGPDAGWQALQRGDPDKAAAIFREQLAEHPGDAVLRFGAGVAAHMLGREDEALKALQQAVRVEPRLTQASALLGDIAYRTGDLDLAIHTYEAALAREPGNLAMRQRLESWRSEASVHQGFEAMKDDRFSIMFQGPAEEKLAVRATTVLGAAFWRIGKAIGAYPSNAITVVLYTDQQFRDITGAPEWAAGGFDGQIRLPVRGAAQNPGEFDRVLTHELTHAMLRSVAPRNLPAWLNEGLAMYFEGHDAALGERRLAAARLFVPLAALQSSFTRLTALQAAIAYEESAMAARALVDRVGTGGVGLLLQDLEAGQVVEQAVQRFGFTLSEFEAALARRVGATPRSSVAR
jgi:tetratricopeptide (TPR) repeat protein